MTSLSTTCLTKYPLWLENNLSAPYHVECLIIFWWRQYMAFSRGKLRAQEKWFDLLEEESGKEQFHTNKITKKEKKKTFSCQIPHLKSFWNWKEERDNLEIKKFKHCFGSIPNKTLRNHSFCSTGSVLL